jgi:hypothetical protein
MKPSNRGSGKYDRDTSVLDRSAGSTQNESLAGRMYGGVRNPVYEQALREKITAEQKAAMEAAEIADSKKKQEAAALRAANRKDRRSSILTSPRGAQDGLGTVARPQARSSEFFG